MSAYTYTINRTNMYCTGTQNVYTYSVDSCYFSATITRYGNQGLDAPIIKRKMSCNGYFWSMNTFLRALYRDKICLHDIKQGQPLTITLEHYQY